MENINKFIAFPCCHFSYKISWYNVFGVRANPRCIHTQQAYLGIMYARCVAITPPANWSTLVHFLFRRSVGGRLYNASSKVIALHTHTGGPASRFKMRLSSAQIIVLAKLCSASPSIILLWYYVIPRRYIIILNCARRLQPKDKQACTHAGRLAGRHAVGHAGMEYSNT